MFKKKKNTREQLKTINALIGEIYSEVSCISTTQPSLSYEYISSYLPTKEKNDVKLERFIIKLKGLRSLAVSRRDAINENTNYLYAKTRELEDKLNFFEEFEVLYLEEADSGRHLTHLFYKCRACKARVEKTERLLHAEQVHYTNVFYTIKTHKGVTTK